MLKGPEVCQAFEVEQITTRKKITLSFGSQRERRLRLTIPREG